MRKIELLAPAGNLRTGIVAIEHGADAVYIGAPKFSARAAAANTIEDIGELVSFAHDFYARVYVALNTLLDDKEIEEAVELMHKLYEAGVDAVIIQDLGLLECELPPIALHASTQMDNRNVAKVQFLEEVGFDQVVLARELGLGQIEEICQGTDITIECFVHGALCVSYSGQCYISEVVAGRSANRGRCAQFCRHRFSLSDLKGRSLGPDRYYLSLRDLNLSQHLRDMILAGVSSFKIEGRLKESSYVKNVTAHYRSLLDKIIDDDPTLVRASSGHCTFSFRSDPKRTFNRGSTEYFLINKENTPGSLDTPKSVGQRLGVIKQVGSKSFFIETKEKLANGDGFCFFDHKNRLHGFRANRVEGHEVFPREEIPLIKGDVLYRNRDVQFLQELERSEPCRAIGLKLCIEEAGQGIEITVTDEDGVRSELQCTVEWQLARQKGRIRESIERQFKKTGGTIYQIEALEVHINPSHHLAVAEINKLRRKAIENHSRVRSDQYRSPKTERKTNNVPWPENNANIVGHITNGFAERFFHRHGISFSSLTKSEYLQEKKDALMTTRYCLRRQLHKCPKKDGWDGVASPLVLTDNTGSYVAHFNCKKCEMIIKTQKK